MKVASFTVRASVAQSARWKIAAEGEAFHSVGAWLAAAADAYLKVRARAGLPVPLGWHRGHFRVELEGGETTVKGHVSPPFGAFSGNEAGPSSYSGRHLYSLAYLPSRQVLATLRTYADCRSLAAELARQRFRRDGTEPPESPAPVLPVPPVRY